MQKLQTSWPALAQHLEEHLRSCTLGLPELAARAQVDYYAVRRMRRDGVKNRTRNAIALCSYFGLAEKLADAMNAEVLAAAAKNAWDGTEGHGQFLLELMKCASRFEVVLRIR